MDNLSNDSHGLNVLDDKPVLKNENNRALIWDIARHSGVSIATVSRVLNGRPDVSDATREKVMQSVRELGYTMRTRHSGSKELINTYLGFTAAQMHSPYFGKVLEGVSEAVQEQDAHVVFCLTNGKYEEEVALTQRFVQGSVKGALFLLPEQSNDDLLHLQAAAFPFVIIDPLYPLADTIPTVAASNISGGRQATEYLISLGHRRIAVITGVPRCCATIDRLAGYHSALVLSGITHNPNYVLNGNFDMEEGYEAAQQLLSLPEPPTAIFAFNDDMAIGTLRAARERGIRVPEQLSIIGFDDAEPASFLSPALTTVQQPLKEMGRLGVDLLFRILNGQHLQVARVELSTRLIIRASTAPYQG